MEWLLETIDDFIDGDGKEAIEEYDWTDTMRGLQTWILECRPSGRISRSCLKVKVIGQR